MFGFDRELARGIVRELTVKGRKLKEIPLPRAESGQPQRKPTAQSCVVAARSIACEEVSTHPDGRQGEKTHAVGKSAEPWGLPACGRQALPGLDSSVTLKSWAIGLRS